MSNGEVTRQFCVVFTGEDQVVDGEKTGIRMFRVQGITGQQRGSGDPSITRLQHQPIIVNACNAVDHLIGMKPYHLIKDIDLAGIPDKLKPVMRYVQKLNETPDQVSQADVDVVYEAGWDEQALCQAALVCAFFNFMNRWVDGLGIETDPHMVKMAGEHLYKKGYKGINELLEQKS